MQNVLSQIVKQAATHRQLVRKNAKAFVQSPFA